MNKLSLVCIVFITACSSLKNFQEQPVVPYKDAKTYKTTCSGMAEDWGSCYRKAKRTCANGYQVVEKEQDSNGIFRKMIFSCNQRMGISATDEYRKGPFRVFELAAVGIR